MNSLSDLRARLPTPRVSAIPMRCRRFATNPGDLAIGDGRRSRRPVTPEGVFKEGGLKLRFRRVLPGRVGVRG